MTEEEAKEAVKLGKRKRSGEDEAEVAEWRARTEDQIAGMRESLERIERLLKMGFGRVLLRLQKLEDSFETESEGEKKEDKGKGKAVDTEESEETEETDSDEETDERDGDTEMREGNEVGGTVGGGEDGVEEVGDVDMA